MRDRRELHLNYSCGIKSSFGLSVFWLASWTGRCPWLLVLLQRSSIPATLTLPLVKEKGIHRCTRTRGVPPACLCFCLWAFVPNQAPGIFRESRHRQRGPPDCHMSGCRPAPITASWSKAKGKYKPWTSQSNMHPGCLTYSPTHTHTQRERNSQHVYMNIFQLIKYSRRHFFFFFFIGENWKTHKLDRLSRLLRYPVVGIIKVITTTRRCYTPHAAAHGACSAAEDWSKHHKTTNSQQVLLQIFYWQTWSAQTNCFFFFFFYHPGPEQGHFILRLLRFVSLRFSIMII